MICIFGFKKIVISMASFSVILLERPMLQAQPKKYGTIDMSG